MIRISWSTRLVLATVFIAACGKASLAAATPDATVTGQVLVKAGGSPVSGRLVSIVTPGEPRKVVQTTRTDADGHYVFTHIPELGMMYVVQLEEQIRSQSIANEDVSVDLIKLDASGVIKTAPTLYTQLTPVSGQVIDVDTGKPVAGVGLGFSTIDNNGSGVTTDEHGTYRLNVRPREIHIVCRGTHDRYYSLDEAKTITVKDGEGVEHIDFKVRSAPAFSGRVLMGDGSPAANARVLVSTMWGPGTVQSGRLLKAAIDKYGAPPPPDGPSLKVRVPKYLTGGEFHTSTNAQGEFTGFLRHPDGPPDEPMAMEIIVVAHSRDRDFAGLLITEATTIDPAIPPAEVHLGPAAKTEFITTGPDGAAIANAAFYHSMRIDYRVNAFGGMDEVAQYVNLGGGHYRVLGLLPGYEYLFQATAPDLAARDDRRITFEPGKEGSPTEFHLRNVPVAR
jgi:hypothetical protein